LTGKPCRHLLNLNLVLFFEYFLYLNLHTTDRKMEKGEILKEVQEIFREVFENPALIVTQSSAPADIHEWDSLTHVLLLSKIEKKFSIKFSLDDMLSFENIGDICNSVSSKTQ